MLIGIKLEMSYVYHPQIYGQIKRLNQCLESYLRCMAGSIRRQWVRWLPLAEYWYNTNYHSGQKCTPYQALYGLPPPHIGLSSYLHSSNNEVKEWILQRQEMVHQLKENLKSAQSKMKFYTNQKMTEMEFEEGEFVYLKLQSFRQSSVSLHWNQKLAARYFGPYKIIEKIDKVAYILELP